MKCKIETGLGIGANVKVWEAKTKKLLSSIKVKEGIRVRVRLLLVRTC